MGFRVTGAGYRRVAGQRARGSYLGGLSSAARRARRGQPLKPRFKPRTGSKTMLMKKKRNNLVRRRPIPASGGLPSFSKFQLVKRPSPSVKAMKKVTAPNYYITNAATQLVINDGFQNYMDFSYNSLADLQLMAGKTPPNAVPPAVEPYKQFVLESSTCEYLMTNSTLATMYVDIYDIVRKRDANQTSASSGPSSAWNNGMTWQSQGVNTDGTIINSLPTDSATFNEWFKIIKRTHVGLAQGATHRHSVLLKPNHLVDTSIIGVPQAGNSNVAGDLAGLTVYTMIVAYGQPISAVSEDPKSTSVTTASGKIDIVKGIRYKYSWCLNNARAYYAVDNLTTLGVEQVVSAGAGAIVPNQSV